MSDEKLLMCPFCAVLPQCVEIDAHGGSLVVCRTKDCAIEGEGKNAGTAVVLPVKR